MTGPGRPDLHVVARFLDRLQDAGPRGLTRSALQRAVGLNYDVFRKYVDLLSARGWVGPAAGPGVRYALTKDGARVRAELVAWLGSLFGGTL